MTLPSGHSHPHQTRPANSVRPTRASAGRKAGSHCLDEIVEAKPASGLRAITLREACMPVPRVAAESTSAVNSVNDRT
jgi:hypothetical protein